MAVWEKLKAKSKKQKVKSGLEISSRFTLYASSLHSLQSTKKAMTLAEVLITLGIIGVVCAMTIPVLMNYFQEQALLTQFNKAYSTISQAYVSAAQDNLTADKWATLQDVYNNLKPYFKVVEDCPTTAGCFPNVTYKGLKGAPSAIVLYGANVSHYKLRLTDGCSISTISAPLGMLAIDINGDKGPNQWGADLFYIKLSTKNNAPYVNYAYNSIDNCSKSLTETSYDGSSCSYWILRHGNMDYLHRDLTSTEWNN